MKLGRGNSLIPLLTVAFLLGLLAVLAVLQYRWLGQISDAERDRLESRLRDDTRRFTEDFDREMRGIYFGFQLNTADIADPRSETFQKLRSNWQNQTQFPSLAESFFYLPADGSSDLEFIESERRFLAVQRSEKLSALRTKLFKEESFPAVLDEEKALAIPIFTSQSVVRKIVLQTDSANLSGSETESRMEMPKRMGILVVYLDKRVLFENLLPALAEKHFSSPDNLGFKVAVYDGKNNVLFGTAEFSNASPDSSAKFFTVKPADFTFTRKTGTAETRKMQNSRIVRREVESAPPDVSKKSQVVSIDLIGLDKEEPRIAVFESINGAETGAWTLAVQHSAGSLEQFVRNARQRNLAISFGILGLLAVSVVLIFVFAQRSKRLARRQMDFVSSVSHEFRTPLSVIYSAGENLTDGVVSSDEQIQKYGNLIKAEGKKLTAMVEQILQFAGARSGRKKYDFRPTEAAIVIDDAVKECKPALDAENFTLRTDIAHDLPSFAADGTALSRALQNLIINAVKYSDQSREIKVAASNGGGDLKISVEDSGIGISKKDRAHIFEPFYRSKMVVDEQIHGNGLGLSLVKEIMEAHKGRVEVESELGKGSKFTLYFPTN